VKYPKNPKGGVVRGGGPCPDCGIRAWRWETNPDADASPDTFRLLCVGCGSLHAHVQSELDLRGDGASWRGAFGTPGEKPQVPEAILIDPDARLPPKLTRELARLAREAMAMPWTFEHGQDWSGENWLLGTLGCAALPEPDADGNQDGTVYLTTDHVRASEVCFDARDDAEWMVAARRLLPELARALTVAEGGQAELERKARDRATTATPEGRSFMLYMLGYAAMVDGDGSRDALDALWDAMTLDERNAAEVVIDALDDGVVP